MRACLAHAHALPGLRLLRGPHRRGDRSRPGVPRRVPALRTPLDSRAPLAPGAARYQAGDAGARPGGRHRSVIPSGREARSLYRQGGRREDDDRRRHGRRRRAARTPHAGRLGRRRPQPRRRLRATPLGPTRSSSRPASTRSRSTRASRSQRHWGRIRDFLVELLTHQGARRRRRRGAGAAAGRRRGDDAARRRGARGGGALRPDRGRLRAHRLDAAPGHAPGRRAPRAARAAPALPRGLRGGDAARAASRLGAAPRLRRVPRRGGAALRPAAAPPASASRTRAPACGWW